MMPETCLIKGILAQDISASPGLPRESRRAHLSPITAAQVPLPPRRGRHIAFFWPFDFCSLCKRLLRALISVLHYRRRCYHDEAWPPFHFVARHEDDRARFRRPRRVSPDAERFVAHGHALDMAISAGRLARPASAVLPLMTLISPIESCYACQAHTAQFREAITYDLMDSRPAGRKIPRPR